MSCSGARYAGVPAIAPVAVRCGSVDSVDAVAERVAFLRAQCAEHGRSLDELRLVVSLRELRPGDVAPLAALGIDELTLVEGPPENAHVAPDWVSARADHWLPKLV